MDTLYHATEEAFKVWKDGHEQLPPSAPTAIHQKAWDLPQVTAMYEDPLETATDPSSRARFLAACRVRGMASHPPYVIPGPSNGQRGDPCVPLCCSHECNLCGANVGSLGTHGLHCSRSIGRRSTTQQSMRSLREPWHQQRLLCIWSWWGSVELMESGRMVLLSHPAGTGGAFSSWMLPAQILLHFSTSSWQSEKWALWLAKWNAGSR